MVSWLTRALGVLCGVLALSASTTAAIAAPNQPSTTRITFAPQYSSLRVGRKTVICALDRAPSRAGTFKKTRRSRVWKRLTKLERQAAPSADARCRRLQQSACAVSIVADSLTPIAYKNEALEFALEASQRPGCAGTPRLEVATPPLHGLLRISEGSAEYVPENDFVGNDAITLRGINGVGTPRTVTIAIAVQETPECSNGRDDDGDGLIDYPLDPKCSDRHGLETPDPAHPRTYTYAFAHWQNIPVGPYNNTGAGIYAWSSPIPPNYHRNVRYPYVLAPDYGTMIPELAKEYLSHEPVPAMFSWTLEQVTPFAINYGFHPADNFPGTSTPSPWMNNWLTFIKPRTDDFFRRFKEIGGELEVFNMDLEWLGAPDAARVTQDPRFNQSDAQFTPSDLLYGSMHQRMGNPAALTSQACGGLCGDYWNGFFQDWNGSYVNKGIYEPMARYFPQVLAANFNWFQYDFENYYTPMFTAVDRCVDGFYCAKGPKFGSAQQIGLAYGRGVLGGGTLKLDKFNVFAQNSFNSMLQQAYSLRGMALSDPTRPIIPLIAGKHKYTGGADQIAQADDFYAELIFHVLLSGAPHLNYWTEPRYLGGDDIPLGNAIGEFDLLMGSLTERISLFDHDSDWIQGIHPSDRSAWSRDWLHTCMKRSATTQLCRFTPRPTPGGGGQPALTAASALLSELDADGNPEVTFMTRQKKLVFPGGRIARVAGSQSAHGYWIVMPLAAEVAISPSGINTLPSASLRILQTDVHPYEILVDAQSSNDPDGRIVRWRYDFNDDGVFGDADVVGDGIVPDVNLNPYGNPAWFQFTFKPTTVVPYYPAYVAPDGIHTVGLEITDDKGGVTRIRSSPFSFTRPYCGAANPSLFQGGPYTCPLASGSGDGS